MTKWLVAANKARTSDNWDKTDKTPKPAPETDVLSQLSVLSRVLSSDLSPYGRGCGGRLRTWTSRVVSIEDWRALSRKERHGTTGQAWNGLTRQWEPLPDTRGRDD